MPKLLRPVLLTLGLLALAASTALGYTERQTWDLHRLNRVRAAHGVGSMLRLGGQLTRRAQYWADQLARHDIGAGGLVDDVSGAHVCWADGGARYGANSALARGYSNDLARDQRDMELSPPHMANMVNSRFRWVGIGIASDRHGVILVQDFCGS